MKLARILAKNLRHYRMKAKITQEELGWRTKLHPTYLGRVERGEDTVSVNNLEKIAKALGVKPGQLLEPQK